MAFEEPEVRVNVEFGGYATFAMDTAGLVKIGNAIKHQHGRQGQAGCSFPQQRAFAAFDNVVACFADQNIVA